MKQKVYVVARPAALVDGNSLTDATRLHSVDVTGASNFTITKTFAQICAAIDSVGAAAAIDANCDPDTDTATVTNYINAVIDNDADGSYGDGDEKIAINLVVKSSVPVNASTSTPLGLYQFTVFPGDEKLIVRDILVESTFPTSTDSVGISKVRFYYTTGPAGCGDAASFAAIGHGSLFQEKTPDPNTAQLDSNRITELENGFTYYVKAALVDKAGNIGYFTSNADSPASHCALTDEVIGLLSESKCFIATATYGSPLASQVQNLREFRDRILLKSKAGQKFVQWYYKNSPAWAAALEKNPDAKQLVRGALYPVVGFSILALKWGPTNASLFFATLALLPFLFFRWNRFQKKRRAQ